jgi:hypothetical protein
MTIFFLSMTGDLITDENDSDEIHTQGDLSGDQRLRVRLGWTQEELAKNL